jgi:hypothetical protein
VAGTVKIMQEFLEGLKKAETERAEMLAEAEVVKQAAKAKKAKDAEDVKK